MIFEHEEQPENDQRDDLQQVQRQRESEGQRAIRCRAEHQQRQNASRLVHPEPSLRISAPNPQIILKQRESTDQSAAEVMVL